MQPISWRRILIALLFTVQVHSSQNNIRDSVLVRAIVRIVTGVHRRELSTLHFIQNHRRQTDIISGVVDYVGSSMAYTVEDVDHINDWYRRWFNIIFISNEREFSSFARRLNHSYFDPRGFYIVVVETVLKAKGREDLSRYVFKTFFSLFYDNVIAMFRDESGAHVFLYTFMPCDGTHACYEVIPILHNIFNGVKFAKGIWHFPQKWQNFNGCPVRVVVNQIPPYVSITQQDEGEPQVEGIDAKVLQMIARHLNFTIDYKVSARGYLYENGTASGSFNMLLKHQASVAIGGYTLSTERVNYLSASLPYIQTEFVYALPVSLEFGSLERHLFPLEKDVWIVYFSIHCGAFIFLSILNKFRAKFYNFIVGDHTQSPFLDMFRMFFGVSLPRTPRWTFARSLFGIWLLTSFILSSSYRCRLVEILTSRSTKAIPRSIDELDAMKYEIYIRPRLQTIMWSLYGNDSRIKVFRDPIWNFLSELQIASDRRRTVMDSLIFINFFNAGNYQKGVLPVLPERVNMATISMLFTKNSYLVLPFDHALRQFGYSGLINKWNQEVVNASFGKSLRTPRSPMTLNLQHFEGTFELYAMVIGVSMLIFVLELISLKWNTLRSIIEFYTYRPSP